MLVKSSGIVNGIIDDRFGKKGTCFNTHGMPTYSLPLKIENAPKNTVSFSIVIEDKDAVPVTKGFSWIHWLVTNLEKNELEENESQTNTKLIQGANSWISTIGGEQTLAASSFYGGMAPPDAPHTYEIHVYALDKLLDLNKSFYMNDLFHKMEGHILESYTLKGTYLD